MYGWMHACMCMYILCMYMYMHMYMYNMYMYYMYMSMSMSMCMCMCMCVSACLHVCICTCTCCCICLSIGLCLCLCICIRTNELPRQFQHWDSCSYCNWKSVWRQLQLTLCCLDKVYSDSYGPWNEFVPVLHEWTWWQVICLPLVHAPDRGQMAREQACGIMWIAEDLHYGEHDMRSGSSNINATGDGWAFGERLPPGAERNLKGSGPEPGSWDMAWAWLFVG